MHRAVHAARLLSFCVSTLFCVAAVAAPPSAPTSLPHQGLLLDGLGQPRAGSVDLEVRVWDAVAGGTLLYKQAFPAVSLADGVFTVQLGPTGDATDVPAAPLTTSLAAALGDDLGPMAPVRYVEVKVGSEPPLSRTQIQSTPYALRARDAASADGAATANDVGAVGGFSSEWVTEFFTYADLDGGLPANTDPLEGTGDVDGDSIPNFLDEDNDGDGVLDATEVANGSHVNLVTPRISGNVSPTSAFFGNSTLVTIPGNNFEAGMTAEFGAQTGLPTTILSSSSARVTIGPQAPGVVNATVRLANGESATRTNAFTFSTNVAHPVTVAGSVPIDTRPGEFQVVLGGTQHYGAGRLASSVFPLASKGSPGKLAVAFDAAGRVAGLRCRDLGASGVVELLLDSDADDALEDETGIAIETIANANATLLGAALEDDSLGHWAAGYVRYDPTIDAAVAHDRNGDGDFADANEAVTLDTNIASFAFATVSALAIDSLDRLAYVYPRATSLDLRVARDRNGDGDFTDTIGGNAETATLAAGSVACVGAAFDGSDRLAVIYATSAGTRLVRDLNDDGDFADVGEGEFLAAAAANGCDVVHRSGHAFAAAYSIGSSQTVFLVDGNEDGDFADAGETTALSVGSNPLGLALDGTSQAIVGTTGFLRFGSAN